MANEALQKQLKQNVESKATMFYIMAFNIMAVIEMKLWFYYTNVYYKYTHGSFNIDNEIYNYFKNNII